MKKTLPPEPPVAPVGQLIGSDVVLRRDTPQDCPSVLLSYDIPCVEFLILILKEG